MILFLQICLSSTYTINVALNRVGVDYEVRFEEEEKSKLEL